MKKTQPLIVIAALLMLGSTLAESLFHAPQAVTMPIFAVALFILWRGIRLQKRAKEQGEASSPVISPSRRFALLFSVFVFASVSGFFILRYNHPEQTAALHVVISAATFLFGVAVSYRQCFRQQAISPSDKNPK